MGSESARDWLKRGTGEDLRLNPPGASQKVTIPCFPYGLGVDIDYGDLDLLAESGLGLGLGIGWVLTLLTLLTVALTVSFYWFIFSNPSRASQIGLLYPLLAVPLLMAPLLWRRANQAKSDISGSRAFKKIEYIIAYGDGLKFVNKRPASSSIGLNDVGLSFHTIAWNNLKTISLVGKEDDVDSAKVSFAGPYGSVVVSLQAIHTRENWSSLVRAIKHYAPHAVIDDSIASALTLSSSNTSFTEVWLESLTRPPDENYLVPIAPGDTVQAGRFTIQDILGVGGQGHAYLAYDAHSGMTP